MHLIPPATEVHEQADATIVIGTRVPRRIDPQPSEYVVVDDAARLMRRAVREDADVAPRRVLPVPADQPQGLPVRRIRGIQAEPLHHSTSS
jgi:hypothetical protein